MVLTAREGTQPVVAATLGVLEPAPISGSKQHKATAGATTGAANAVRAVAPPVALNDCWRFLAAAAMQWCLRHVHAGTHH